MSGPGPVGASKGSNHEVGADAVEAPTIQGTSSEPECPVPSTSTLERHPGTAPPPSPPPAPTYHRLTPKEFDELMVEVERARQEAVRRPEPEAERKERTAILATFVRGITPPPSDPAIATIREAMKGFSVEVLRRLQAHGVRVWPRGEPLPPGMKPLEEELKRTKQNESPYGNPSYYPAGRVILLGPSFKASSVRHELAHGLDDALDERRPRRLDDLTMGAREREVAGDLEGWATLSETDKAYRVAIGGKTEQLTMGEMHRRYAARAKYNELAFDQQNARRGHSVQDVREFFAEAMAVFNGDDIAAQARLLRMAPEMYALLEQRNKSAGLPAPDRQLLERVP